ncbi:MAG TPA: hypothetical protein VMT53_24250 [Terriglobales bacterium]|nr:hypothetical protein [Terriglobales bacterium]
MLLPEPAGHTLDRPSRPPGFAAIGVFFCFGSVMAAYAAVTLVRRGTCLDRLWALNRRGHIALAGLGPMVAVPFGVLSMVLVLAALGWFRRQYWGWLLGTAVIATNLAADFIHALLGDWLRSGVGVIIAGLLLFYLTRPRVRTYFLPRSEPH